MNKSKVKKKYIYQFIIVLLLVVIVLFVIIFQRNLGEFNLKESEIAEISVWCIDGEAIIDEKEDVKEIISDIDDVVMIKGDDSLGENIGGDTPDAMLSFYDEKENEIHWIYLYGNQILFDDKYYKIIGDADKYYNNIVGMCEKYGMVY